MSLGQSQRHISRAEGNLELRGDLQPDTSQLEAVYIHSLINNPSLGMYQEIHPYSAMNFDGAHGPRVEGNIEVGGDVQFLQPNTSRLEALNDHSLIKNPSLGMYQEIHPCRAFSIDSA